MIETESLILDKGKESDWEDMYRTVWSQPSCAKYMFWSLTANEEDAKVRMGKSVEFQKSHDAYLVYEKATGKAIGFAGVKQIAPTVYQETGICLGPGYVGKGFGTQILQGLLQYCKNEHQAEAFIYFTREENIASNRLAKSFGFTLVSAEPAIDPRDGHPYQLLKYSLKL